ncbi:hypothetical protein V6Z88_006260 [Aspergillus fumigatus]
MIVIPPCHPLGALLQIGVLSCRTYAFFLQPAGLISHTRLALTTCSPCPPQPAAASFAPSIWVFIPSRKSLNLCSNTAIHPHIPCANQLPPKKRYSRDIQEHRLNWWLSPTFFQSSHSSIPVTHLVTTHQFAEPPS